MSEPARHIKIVEKEGGQTSLPASLHTVNMDLPQQESHDDNNWIVSYADMMTLLVGFFVVLQSFSSIDSSKFEKIKKETTQFFGGEYIIPYENLASSLKKIVADKNLNEQVLFHQTDTGIDITFRGALFFDSGSVTLKNEAKTLLAELIPAISVQAKDFGIVVEGHTDNTPISNSLYSSNWELSSVRACTVLRLFEEDGFDPKKLKAIGWGEHKPIVPNVTSTNVPIKENQNQNRRVVIKILKDNTLQ